MVSRSQPAWGGGSPPPERAAGALALDGVSFTYPSGVRALEDVTLAVRAGEAVALVGQNGSGKSTLVRHLNGLLRPDRGAVLVEGSDIRERHVAEISRLVGLAFQNPDRQVFASRVRAEVAFGPHNLGLRGKELDVAVEEALESVGLAGAVDANPYDLGGSRRKLLAIASILAMRTPIVILDEPTTGQDQRGIARVREIITGLNAEGRTVLAISHDMRFVAETFGRVVVMRAGRVVLDGSVADVFAEPAWPVLAATHLEPPLAARVGAQLGVGSTPTEDGLVAALVQRAQ